MSNISLVESGNIVTAHQAVSNVFNNYFVDVTADIGNQDSGEAGHAVNTIRAVHSNHDYRVIAWQKMLLVLKRSVLTLLEKISGVSIHGRQLDMMES